RLRCWPSEGTHFGAPVFGPAWPVDTLLGAPANYGSLRMADIDGDGRSDACMIELEGFRCYASEGSGFSSLAIAVAWDADEDLSQTAAWSTLRLADLSGDGRADACLRGQAGYLCAVADGAGFGAPQLVAELSDAAGWSDPTNYLTIRTGDIDLDGQDETCARADDGMRCWTWDGLEPTQLEGPAWTDAQGWPAPSFMHSIRLVDATGDGRADLCGRGSQGWRCIPSQGHAFSGQFTLGALTDADGADAPSVYGTILSGGRSCGTAFAPACTFLEEDDPGETSTGTAGDETTGGETGTGTDETADPSESGDDTYAAGDHDPSGGCACRADPLDRRWSGMGTLLLVALGWRRRRQRGSVRESDVNGA
ncbi:MAG: hypothetical protein KC457_08580, partial [Myxococcales bacterium]|nr:hypothetical protein [Myxococcales bacterium]